MKASRKKVKITPKFTGNALEIVFSFLIQLLNR